MSHRNGIVVNLVNLRVLYTIFRWNVRNKKKQKKKKPHRLVFYRPCIVFIIISGGTSYCCNAYYNIIIVVCGSDMADMECEVAADLLVRRDV